LLWSYRDTVRVHLTLPKDGETVDDVNPAIVYSGQWTHALFRDAAKGTTSFSTAIGSSARVSFTGTSVTWVYARAFNRGIASVKIDGVPRGDVDLYSANIVWQASTMFKDLSPGAHTLELTVSGRKDKAAADRYIDLDAFVIR
jgi:hypothetical protein